MKRLLIVVPMFVALGTFLMSDVASADDASRNRTREQLRKLLDEVGPDIDVSFKQGTTNEYNFFGMLETGLEVCDSLEIVIGVTNEETILVRVFPHYNGGYVNLDNVPDAEAVTRKLLEFTAQRFFYWGADDVNDVFAGFTFTLESGFPPEAMEIVLLSIKNLDRTMSDLQPLLK